LWAKVVSDCLYLDSCVVFSASKMHANAFGGLLANSIKNTGFPDDRQFYFPDNNSSDTGIDACTLTTYILS